MDRIVFILIISNYLKAIPLDVIKIDKCFISDIGISSKNEALIDLVIRIAQSFGAESVSEGVETIEQLRFLIHKGCYYLQGYYFSKPLREVKILEKINETNSFFYIRNYSGFLREPYKEGLRC